MTNRPRCFNRPPFGPLKHPGDADRGIAPSTWPPQWKLMGCGSFADVQDLKDGRGPLPLPVRDGWACAGCRWLPVEHRPTPAKKAKRRNPNSAIHIAPRGERRPEERRALSLATGMRC